MKRERDPIADRPIRFGLVGGAGSFIGDVHRAAARLDGRFEFVAGCLSSDPARGREAGTAAGLAADRIYASHEEMAEAEAARRDGVELVAILTPNHLHHRMARSFLARGCHVVCEKPVALRSAEALELAALARSAGRVCAVAHAYTGYATVRHARALVQSGATGAIRVVQVEYAQGWLARPLEADGHVVARRRTDPATNGAAGCVHAIGGHAFNLAEFVTGLALAEVAAEATAFVPGRLVPDDARVLLRYEGGARGMLWVSQVAPGHDNGLRIRVYGERGSLAWSQQDPDHLMMATLDQPPSRISRRGPSDAPWTGRPTPPGHPEGFVDAFAAFYGAVADRIRGSDGALPFATCDDGARAVRFAEAVLESSAAGGAWTDARLAPATNRHLADRDGPPGRRDPRAERETE